MYVCVFPGGSAGKESACSAGDMGSLPGLGRCPGEGKGSPLQCSGLENSMDCIVRGVAKSRTRLGDLTSRVYVAHIFFHTLFRCDLSQDADDGSL